MKDLNTKFQARYANRCQSKMHETKAECFVFSFWDTTQGMGRAALDEVEAWNLFELTEAELCADFGEDFTIVFLDGSKARWENASRNYRLED